MPNTATWTVLFVEDNAGDVALLRQCIELYTGIELMHVPNAVQANLFLARKSPFEDVPVPDLVLLDLRMPIFDGSSVLQCLQGSPLRERMPVVVFTSSQLPKDIQRCRELGATDYVSKPIHWKEWQTTIHRIFRQHLKNFTE